MMALAFLNATWGGVQTLRQPNKIVTCPRQRTCNGSNRLMSARSNNLRTPMTSSMTSSSSSSSSKTVEKLKDELMGRLEGYNFGLDFDPDAEDLGDDENAIEDIIEQIEDTNDSELSTTDPRMNGTWDLVYTSSTISRYYGGLTGVHSYLPEGAVEEIKQEINIEDATCTMTERIRFEIPFSEREGHITVKVIGKLRLMGENRMVWNAENVMVGIFKWFAEGWKSLRAMTIVDLTYLNESVRIVRGQTGAVHVFIKSANQN